MWSGRPEDDTRTGGSFPGPLFALLILIAMVTVMLYFEPVKRPAEHVSLTERCEPRPTEQECPDIQPDHITLRFKGDKSEFQSFYYHTHSRASVRPCCRYHEELYFWIRVDRVIEEPRKRFASGPEGAKMIFTVERPNRFEADLVAPFTERTETEFAFPEFRRDENGIYVAEGGNFCPDQKFVRIHQNRQMEYRTARGGDMDLSAALSRKLRGADSHSHESAVFYRKGQPQLLYGCRMERMAIGLCGAVFVHEGYTVSVRYPYDLVCDVPLIKEFISKKIDRWRVPGAEGEGR